MTVRKKEAFKKEQFKWLRESDDYFKDQDKEFEDKLRTGEWGPDMYMIAYDNDAEFVKARVLKLAFRLNN